MKQRWQKSFFSSTNVFIFCQLHSLLSIAAVCLPSSHLAPWMQWSLTFSSHAQPSPTVVALGLQGPGLVSLSHWAMACFLKQTLLIGQEWFTVKASNFLAASVASVAFGCLHLPLRLCCSPKKQALLLPACHYKTFFSTQNKSPISKNKVKKR